MANEGFNLIPIQKNISWNSCHTLYFTSKDRVIQNKLIGLVAQKEILINNIFYHTCLSTSTRSDEELLSVTIINTPNLSQETIISQVTSELKEYCGIKDLTFLKYYHIPKALPNRSNLHYDLKDAQSFFNNTVFVAGDQEINGSLNAAMLSGQSAALAVIKQI